ncbi:MAG TPA: BatA domain-containing protein [Gemmatimonadaceae bacterium]|nr:BatA domain-containing protein [Gemmatimonadaceae bacterium]
MTWLVPSALAIAGVAALVAIGLHLIARSRPVAEALPTARFIPLRAVHARTRSLALSDVLLLVVRMAAILLIGAAVAAPIVASARGRVARILVVDRSRDVASVAEVRDSVRSLLDDVANVVFFDSAARAVGPTAADSLSLAASRGSISAALASAIQTASVLSTQTDSVEMVIVSPFGEDELDAATLPLRASWPGRIRLVSVQGAAPVDNAARIESIADANDPVIVGLSFANVSNAGRAVRITRDKPTPADTAWARDSGHVLVQWPGADSAADWPRRATIDAIGGVTSATGTLVGRFPRAWTLGGRAIARWADGDIAANEVQTGGGCIRDVSVLVDPASDITLRAPFRRFASALLAPCGGARSARRVDDSTLAGLAGSGRLAAVSAFRANGGSLSAWTPWLLVAGAVLLLVELAVRRAVGQL